VPKPLMPLVSESTGKGKRAHRRFVWVAEVAGRPGKWA
jgi:hypothetical protein